MESSHGFVFFPWLSWWWKEQHQRVKPWTLEWFPDHRPWLPMEGGVIGLFACGLAASWASSMGTSIYPQGPLVGWVDESSFGWFSCHVFWFFLKRSRMVMVFRIEFTVSVYVGYLRVDILSWDMFRWKSQMLVKITSCWPCFTDPFGCPALMCFEGLFPGQAHGVSLSTMFRNLAESVP